MSVSLKVSLFQGVNGSYSTHIYTEHAINTLNGFAENNVPKWFMYLLRSILMSTWGFCLLKKWGENEKEWARNGLTRVG